jgi:hypothetical protein
VRKSLTSVAGVAALILALDVPVVAVAAQPETRFPTENKEATADRTAIDALAAAQARLSFSLIEKVANGNNVAARCRSLCMPLSQVTTGRVDATVSPASLAAALGIVSQGVDHARRPRSPERLQLRPNRPTPASPRSQMFAACSPMLVTRSSPRAGSCSRRRARRTGLCR